MKLKVLGSSSKGNCYILENEDEALIIDAGVLFIEIKKALDFNIRKIVGVCCTHVHKDHSRAVEEYEKAGIYVFKPYQDTTRLLYCGRFEISAFKLVHNVPCFGFYITHSDIGTMVYITDTEYCKYHFKGINHILVEANYSPDLIQDDSFNWEHVLKGHMSLETTLGFISANDNVELRNTVLLHLSNDNADPELFRQRAREVLKHGELYIAEKGLIVDLNLCPF